MEASNASDGYPFRVSVAQQKSGFNFLSLLEKMFMALFSNGL